MASSHTATLDNKLAQQATMLTPAQKREAIDFMTFIADRSRKKKLSMSPAPRSKSKQSLEGIFDIAPGDAGETDLAINHDKYLYGFDSE